MIVPPDGLSSILSLIGYLDSLGEPRPFRLQEAEGVGEDLTRGAWEGGLGPLSLLDGGDPGLDLSQPAAQCLVVGGFGNQRQVGQSHQDRLRDHPETGYQRDGFVRGDPLPLRGGPEHPPRPRARTSLDRLDQAALLQLREHVVDRRETDVGPLPDAALLDHSFQVVTVPGMLDEQPEHGQFGGGQHAVILALEYPHASPPAHAVLPGRVLRVPTAWFRHGPFLLRGPAQSALGAGR